VEILNIGEDIFFLTIDEVLSALAADNATFPNIGTRQELYQRYRALPPYSAIICGCFDPFARAADPNRRSDIFDLRVQPAPVTSTDGNTIKGAAGALGVVVGTVRRLDFMEESNLFQAGEVLVTTITNIGWTPLFSRSASIVTDLRASLSHVAIVARELGIPGVVG
jgi:rifampicin phosphotransferase